MFGQFPPEGQQAVKKWAGEGWAPLGRLATTAEIANACSLLCSEEASFVTGQSIAVDGGTSLMNPDFPLAIQLAQ
jgi:NAD(P)-dependent dehydrogenase (short-subunit alcohol dehydrogenase family)